MKTRLIGTIFILIVVIAVFINLFRARRYRDYLGANVLAVTNSSLCVFSIRPKANVMDYSRLPDALKVSLEIGGGSYDVAGLRKVGIVGDESLDKLRKAVGQEIGISLAFVIKIKGECDGLSLKEGLLDLGSKTNISIFDRLSLSNDVGQLDTRGLGFEQIFPSSTFDKVTEPDGKTFLKVNQAMQFWNKNHYVSDEVLAEGTEVAVINASGKEGLAREVSKQFETTGIRVVEINKSETMAMKCRVMGDEKKHRLTFEYINYYFGCDKVVGNSGNPQFDVVIMMGSSY